MTSQAKNNKERLIHLNKQMAEHLLWRDELIDKLVNYEFEIETYELSEIEEERGIQEYYGYPFEDVKHDLLKEISVITSFLDHLRVCIDKSSMLDTVLTYRKHKTTNLTVAYDDE